MTVEWPNLGRGGFHVGHGQEFKKRAEFGGSSLWRAAFNE
jgi:hypothetical protein